MKTGPKEQALKDLRKARRAQRKELDPAPGKSEPTPSAPPPDAPKEKVMPTKTKAAPVKKARRPKPAVRPGSKLETVVKLMTRKEGTTAAEVLASTGWPTVSMPQMAKAAGLRLRKEKEGAVTRYRA